MSVGYVVIWSGIVFSFIAAAIFFILELLEVDEKKEDKLQHTCIAFLVIAFALMALAYFLK